jgi:hypothetical protein
MAQKMFEAKVSLPSGGMPLFVSVSANDMHQAKKMIEAQYQPKQWFSAVREKK